MFSAAAAVAGCRGPRHGIFPAPGGFAGPEGRVRDTTAPDTPRRSPPPRRRGDGPPPDRRVSCGTCSAAQPPDHATSAPTSRRVPRVAAPHARDRASPSRRGRSAARPGRVAASRAAGPRQPDSRRSPAAWPRVARVRPLRPLRRASRRHAGHFHMVSPLTARHVSVCRTCRRAALSEGYRPRA